MASDRHFYRLEKLVDLGPGYRRGFKIDDHRLLLVEDADEYHLVGGLCPHQGNPLQLGTVVDGAIQCPFHGYRFDLLTGEPSNATGAAVACRKLRIYELVYEGADIGVWL